MNFITNERIKIGDEVGEIPGARQTKIHQEMIANFLSMNEMTKNNG